MWNSAKDPQKEKYQRKIEAILEEQHKAILERSHLLINIIFVLLGAYAVILSAIFFSSLSFSSNSTASNSLDQSFSGPLTNIFLGCSISFILIAFGCVVNSFAKIDLAFKDKFEQNTDDMNLLVCFKDDKKLEDRNNQLFEVTKNLLKNNDKSMECIYYSLLLFINYIISLRLTFIYFCGFLLIFSAILLYVMRNEIHKERRNK